MSEIVVVGKENFETEVLKATGTVLVDFWAAWCGPCRMIAPVIAQIAAEEHPGLKICKIDVDEQTELAQQFEVLTIPTLKVFRDGQMVNEGVGVMPKAAILKLAGLA